MLAVLAAVLIMGDRLTAINTVGLAIVIVGVLLFNCYKYRKMRTGQTPVRTGHKSAGEDKLGEEESESTSLLSGSPLKANSGIQMTLLAGAGVSSRSSSGDIEIGSALPASGGSTGLVASEYGVQPTVASDKVCGWLAS